MASSTDEQEVLEQVRGRLGTGEATTTTLATDNRVLSRITDGIYRSPTAAIRELVANAYDAGATNVTIEMNPPFFDRITIRDDGDGMDEAALVRLIKHIGGSSKRTPEGQSVGTTGADPSYSPSGRRLIGRIGIGLFSVSQMTRHFQIVTKRAGGGFRIFADILLDVFSEERGEEGDGTFRTGQVVIQSFPAKDIESHGTDIILCDLKPEARALLSSSEDREAGSDFAFHAGVGDFRSISEGGDIRYQIVPKLPWEPSDLPDVRFQKLYSEVVGTSGRQKAKLGTILDRYLQLMWSLALAVPLDYIGGVHPFDLTSESGIDVYRLSNAPGGAATRIELDGGQSIREQVGLITPEKGGLPFRVTMDGVELKRPVDFSWLGLSYAKPKDKPLLFVGQWAPSLDSLSDTSSGGKRLAFEGYFLWLPRIIPAEHTGLLVRMADASSMSYDESFMDYRIAELTRLRQTTAEIFVRRGLDAALNIDRESFNFGHPHAKIVRYWVHQALRQLATTQKRIASEKRSTQKTAEVSAGIDAIRKVVESKLEYRPADAGQVKIVSGSTEEELVSERMNGALVFDAPTLFDQVPDLKGKAVKHKLPIRLAKLEAIAQLLEGFGVFANLTFEQQDSLLNGIAQVVWSGSDE